MGHVHVRLDVSFEDQSEAHSVLPSLCHINRCLDSASQLELVSFNGDDLDEGHFHDELLGELVVEAILLAVPAGAFDKETLDVGSMLKSLLDVLGALLLSHSGVEGGLVKSPSLGAASGLYKSGQVRLGNRQA